MKAAARFRLVEMLPCKAPTDKVVTGLYLVSAQACLKCRSEQIRSFLILWSRRDLLGLPHFTAIPDRLLCDEHRAGDNPGARLVYRCLAGGWLPVELSQLNQVAAGVV